jgi:hypothetical protein
VISKVLFLRCKPLSWAAVETRSRLSQLTKEAFRERRLTSIHLPASVTVISEFCFCRCGSLASITCDPASQLQEIRRNAFGEVPVEVLILPGGIRHLAELAFAERRLETVSFSPLSTKFTVSDSIVQDISGRFLNRYLGKGDTVRIESSAEGICEGCFTWCESVKSVVFHENSPVSRLEALAFFGSSLTSIHLHTSVTVIGKFCFSGCGSLVSISSKSSSQLSELAKKAFRASGLTSIHLPASVTVIGESCCYSAVGRNRRLPTFKGLYHA